MPTMSNECYAYFSTLASSDKDVRESYKSISDIITDFDNECAQVGLVRGIHYTLTPLSEGDISEILDVEDHKYPSKVPLYEVKFRSKKHLELAKSTGLVEEAAGDESERLIWG